MNSSERREAVTALAVKAKTDHTVIPELWSMVERFVRTICTRYCRSNGFTRVCELDDLCQTAYFGFIKAVDAFEPSRSAFPTYLSFHIRNSCRREIYKCSNSKDPINSAASIDKPLDDIDGITLADTIQDPRAQEDFSAVDLRMLVDVILAEADKLPHIQQRRIIRECTYQGRALTSFANEIGISREAARMVEGRALNTLRHRPVIRKMYREYRTEESATILEIATSPYRVKGATSYNSDFTSVVEAIVLSMDMRERKKYAPCL